MIQIKGYQFVEKFAEMNLKQRNYQGESIVSIELTCEFFPNYYEEAIVSGAVQITFDCNHLRSLDELSEKKEQGELGKITISINKNGIWEHKTLYQYEIEFQKRVGNQIPVIIKAEELEINVSVTIVSLYSVGNKKLEEVFNLDDFHPVKLEKEIGNSTIIKYIAKG